MTKKRNDNHSTEFGLWLREQSEIDSKLGFTTSNIDYVWHNYKTGEWMFVEEKRHGAKMSFSQHQIFKKVHAACFASEDKKYRGFHLLVFENTSPDDGKMWLNNSEISRNDLIVFLREFKRP